MEEKEASTFAYDAFMQNHDAFLFLMSQENPEIAYEMVLLEVCSIMHLLDAECLEEFFNDICAIKKNLEREIYEDESDFMECVTKTMESIRGNPK